MGMLKSKLPLILYKLNCGTGQPLAKLTVTQLQLINLVDEFDSTATNLGVVLDGQLSQQLTAICR